MASFFAHAAVPLVVAQAVKPPRRVLVAAVVLACIADLDMLTFAFELRTTDLLGHRGFFHSFAVAALLAGACGLVFFRAYAPGSRAWWRVVAFLFFAAASHGILDVLTASEAGVALFAPFANERLLSPWRPIPSLPGGVNEALGLWGLLVIANEVLYVVVPLAIAVQSATRALPPRRIAMSVVVWAAAVIGLRAMMPEWFTARVPRIVMAMGSRETGDPRDLPHDDLPGGKLVTRFDELRALGLFDKSLVPTKALWSSSFFPSWFGGEGGRWTEPAPRLVWRTITGADLPTASDVATRSSTLAPTEKVDIVFGAKDFPLTAQALSHSHNKRPRPRYWSGRCNGVSNAALSEPEPFRVVDVKGCDGTHVRFHPNDVKALLSVAYYDMNVQRSVGLECTAVTSFDMGAVCSMNPAVLVLAVLNRIGIAHQSFLIDALPSIAMQFYPVAEARVAIAAEPHAVGSTPIEPALASRVASVVDLDVTLTLSSTTLRYAQADVLERSDPTGTTYQHVGVVPVVAHYGTTLALDSSGEILGGRWTGEPPDGPDDVVIVDGGPVLDANGFVASSNRLYWPFVKALARASVTEGAAAPELDLRSVEGACR